MLVFPFVMKVGESSERDGADAKLQDATNPTRYANPRACVEPPPVRPPFPSHRFVTTPPITLNISTFSAGGCVKVTSSCGSTPRWGRMHVLRGLIVLTPFGQSNSASAMHPGATSAKQAQRMGVVRWKHSCTPQATLELKCKMARLGWVGGPRLGSVACSFFLEPAHSFPTRHLPDLQSWPTAFA